VSDEDEYFKRIDLENKAKLKAKLDAEAAEQALIDRKVIHHNRCGKCGGLMDTQVFRGIEIELCPDCGAVLLDPGELQQLAGNDQSGVFAGFFSQFKAKN
jgi:hypothetical protein